MDREDVLEAEAIEPDLLNTAGSLMKYQENFDTGFHFTDKEAELIVGYMEGHGYVLGQIDGVLYRGDMEDKPETIVWEEFSMDDVIDSVCEWNYEFILDMDAERQHAENFIDFGNKQDRYLTLKEEEKVLDRLFDQTKYAVVIEKTAERLANEFIANLSKSKDVDTEVKKLTTYVLQPQVKERSR